MASTEVRTLPDLVRTQARLRGDRVALTFEDQSTTFAQLDAWSGRIAHALIAAGIRPGDRVALLDHDSDHALALLFGIAKSRGVILGINWRLSPSEIAFILNDGQAKLLFAGAAFESSIAKVAPRLETVRETVALTGEVDGWPSLTTWTEAQPDTDPGLPADPEEVVVQMYTSGTTGHPKGVQLANRSFFAVVQSMREHGDPWIGWTADDVSLSGFPSFHIGGFWWMMTGMSAGARTVILPAFQGWRALELIEKEGITKTCLVPAMMQLMLTEPSCAQTDFSSLTHIVYGGSPIPLPLLERSIEVFGCEFAQIYGLTETGNTAVCLRPEDHRGRPELLRAAGRPYPGVRMKVVDSDGQPVPPGEIGEICLHSPANMIGYWNRPEATAETLVEGWVHTGDAGSVDVEGYVTVCDRVKDMIISAGENIYPAEIESVLCGHPGVAEAAVIGVPDDRWGELVKAIVVRAPGTQATATEIIAHAREEIAAFKVPRSIDFVDTLPRTPSGKVQKVKLREPYWEGRDRRVN